MKPIVRHTLTAALLGAGIAPNASALAAPQSAAGGKKFTGPVVAMRWGPVQVKVNVQGRTIVNVSATAPADRTRSAFINAQALPLLKAEVLKAQSPNVSIVSGATLTSTAYLKSLQGAMAKAHL